MKAVIDRIENNIAVLVIEGKTINLPVEFFGFKVHEGQHLIIILEPDEESTPAEQKEEIIDFEKDFEIALV